MKATIARNMKSAKSLMIVVASGLVVASASEATLVSHYTFDTDYSDSGSIPRNGTLVGSGGIVAAPGPDGSTGYLSLSGGYIDLPAYAGPGWITAATITAWVKLDSNNGSGQSEIFAQDWNSPAANGTIQIAQTDGPSSGIFAASKVTVSASVPAPPTGWYHLAWVYNGPGAFFDVYTNGVIAASTWYPWEPWSGYALKGMDGDAAIGSWVGSYLFHGQIDDFRIYDNALTAGQIAALAVLVEPTVPEPGALALVTLGGLLVWWRRRQ